MPTVLWFLPSRFFFYSRQNQEPPHIHVAHEEKVAKYWLDPVALASNHGFRSHELAQLRSLVVQHRELFLEAWHGFCAG
jgi:hypothetical protein